SGSVQTIGSVQLRANCGLQVVFHSPISTQVMKQLLTDCSSAEIISFGDSCQVDFKSVKEAEDNWKTLQKLVLKNEKNNISFEELSILCVEPDSDAANNMDASSSLPILLWSHLFALSFSHSLLPSSLPSLVPLHSSPFRLSALYLLPPSPVFPLSPYLSLLLPSPPAHPLTSPSPPSPCSSSRLSALPCSLSLPRPLSLLPLAFSLSLFLLYFVLLSLSESVT
ncbi:hypothetical protein C7M84_005670, partial [Penaeus vannamei]